MQKPVFYFFLEGGFTLNFFLDKGGKKDKAGASDEEIISYHGIAYVDLAPLLYPGVCSVAGAFKIHPFNEGEMLEKVAEPKIKHCMLRTTIKFFFLTFVDLTNPVFYLEP